MRYVYGQPMYVGRWNNGTGYMEWAGRPVDSIDKAAEQVKDCLVMGVDICIATGPQTEGDVVAVYENGGWRSV